MSRPFSQPRGQVVLTCLGLVLLVILALLMGLAGVLYYTRPEWLPHRLNHQEIDERARACLPGQWSKLKPLSGESNPFSVEFKGDGFNVVLSDYREASSTPPLGTSQDRGLVLLKLKSGPTLASWIRYTSGSEVRLAYQLVVPGPEGLIGIQIFGPQTGLQASPCRDFLASLNSTGQAPGPLQLKGNVGLDDVPLGASIDRAQETLGEPQSRHGGRYSYERPALTLDCFPDGTIYRMQAKQFRKDGQVIVQVGGAPTPSLQALGEPQRVVIPGWNLKRTRVYQDDRSVYLISLQEGKEVVLSIEGILLADAPAQPPVNPWAPSPLPSPGETPVPFQPATPQRSRRSDPPFVANNWIKSPADYPDQRPLEMAGPPLAVNLVRLGMTREDLLQVMGPPAKESPMKWQNELRPMSRQYYEKPGRVAEVTVDLSPEGRVVGVQGNALTQAGAKGERILLVQGRSQNWQWALNLGPESEHFRVIYGPGVREGGYRQDWYRQSIFVTEHELLILFFRDQELYHVTLLPQSMASRRRDGVDQLDCTSTDFTVDRVGLGATRQELIARWGELTSEQDEVVSNSKGWRARLQGDKVVALEGSRLEQKGAALCGPDSEAFSVDWYLRTREWQFDEQALWEKSAAVRGGQQVGMRSWTVQTKQGQYVVVAPRTRVEKVYATAYRARSLQPASPKR